MALVGVGLDRGPDDRALAEMAWCFAEEYARMGYSEERILRMFKNPFYRGPYRVLSVKGEEFVRGVIGAVGELRSKMRARVGDRP